MQYLQRHALQRRAPGDGQLLRYANGRPVTRRRYDYLRERLGKILPWVATQQVSAHWLGPTRPRRWPGRGGRRRSRADALRSHLDTAPTPRSIAVVSEPVLATGTMALQEIRTRGS